VHTYTESNSGQAGTRTRSGSAWGSLGGNAAAIARPSRRNHPRAVSSSCAHSNTAQPAQCPRIFELCGSCEELKTARLSGACSDHPSLRPCVSMMARTGSRGAMKRLRACFCSRGTALMCSFIRSPAPHTCWCRMRWVRPSLQRQKCRRRLRRCNKFSDDSRLWNPNLRPRVGWLHLFSHLTTPAASPVALDRRRRISRLLRGETAGSLPGHLINEEQMSRPRMSVVVLLRLPASSPQTPRRRHINSSDGSGSSTSNTLLLTCPVRSKSLVQPRPSFSSRAQDWCSCNAWSHAPLHLAAPIPRVLAEILKKSVPYCLLTY
jgi:hypothetical protein